MMKYLHSINDFAVIVITSAAFFLAGGCMKEATHANPVKDNRAVCGEIAERFAKVLAGGSGACAKNAGCGCYNPVSRDAGCGGVTDRATADRLRRLESEFRRAGCEWPIDCEAWLCDPRCERGRCVNGR